VTQDTAGFPGEAKTIAMRLTGIALLWVALSTLAYIPGSSDAAKATIVAVLGFASFAAGLSLFADALKRDIIAKIVQGQRG
jgi:hypothetical protein